MICFHFRDFHVCGFLLSLSSQLVEFSILGARFLHAGQKNQFLLTSIDFGFSFQSTYINFLTLKIFKRSVA